jgi:Fic family protein
METLNELEISLSERHTHLLKSGVVSTYGPYLAKEDLATHAAPEFLTLRDWWDVLKIQRLLGRRECGLKDRQGYPFTLGSIEFFAEIIHNLDRMGRGESVIEVGESTAHAGDRLRLEHLKVVAMRDEAMASAELDGAVINPVAAHDLLRSGRKPRDRNERQVVNVHHVMQRIAEIRTQPLTLSLLADLHQRLIADTVVKPSLANRLRREDKGASASQEFNQPHVKFEPPAAAELPVRLKLMLAFANGHAPEKFVHPLLRAAALHFWVLHDQPFTEGNGRLARALYYWSVLNAGYEFYECLAPSMALRDSPAAYRHAFDQVLADDNDLMYFVAHQFGAVAKAQRRMRDEVGRWDDELQATEKLTDAGELNDRQKLLIARALREPSMRRTLQEHARDHNLARQTARNDFAPLVKNGWFEEVKVGKALTFFPVADLAGRLGGAMN